ncbi:hypothetical protein CBR_g42149 [Chara braunii]|uniref:DUF659 domain-containing protein n=1 Tax=Chara braunii TaxID=69332 RepID=A0A388LX67_CHABU|nr:hypothetical protein CBR_g42149 [Chara braunii]|eukprot:GBG86865.1 hypothetical protein CBR_g42149 [Chara braunii]
MTGGRAEGDGRRPATAAEKMKGPVQPSCDTPGPSTQRTKSTVSSASASGKEPTPGTDPDLFEGRGEAEHAKLRLKNTVWKWCEQGQEVATSKGRGEYWVRCRLCGTIFRGSASKAVEHFLKVMKPCAMRTGEIVHTLVAAGAKVHANDKNTKYLLKNYKGSGAESEVLREDGPAGGEGCDDPQTNEPRPPVVAGRSVADSVNLAAAALGQARGGDGAVVGGLSDEGQGSTARVVASRETTVRRWVDNEAQKRLDIAWAEAMFRAGIAFNFLNMDTTQALHAVYLEVVSARLKVKLPSFNHMRTVMVDVIYLKIQKEVLSLTKCWDTFGCTFISDGSTDRRNRPVMNFLAAGVREIGLERINAICTDDAEVNKKAAQILERRKDKDVARIPWVPCGAHCCSLLLKDLANLSWIKGTVKTANTIVKFIRNHHATNGLMMSIDDTKSLLRPTEVRFGSVYMMLQRLEDREDVLTVMVDGREAAKWRSLRWSGEKLRKKVDLVYYTVRSESSWPEVKRMDAEGTSPTNLVEYDELIARKLTNVVLTKKEREDVMEKVRDRMQMMRQPVHAAAFLLDPQRRNPRWLFDQDNALVQNAMSFLLRQVGGEWNSQAHSNIWAELMEFHKERTRQAPSNLEPGKAPKKRKDEHMWKRVAKDGASRLAPADWWAAHGGDVPDLQKIAVKVMGMWSTATLAERNWASMDFVHSKRRNSLSPESLEKLVYIHWNMQLLRARSHKDSGYVDVWGSYFEPLMEPEKNDGSLLPATVEDAVEKEEEERRQRNMAKAPRGRIPKDLFQSDSDSRGSSNLEDLVWKGKCWNESSSEDCSKEEGGDSDFELHEAPTVPATTYVGRRRRQREREFEVEPMPVVDRVDTDVEFLLHPHDDLDEEEAARAKAMADRDADLVEQRMRAEEARRAALPTRRERERNAAQQNNHTDEPANEVDMEDGENIATHKKENVAQQRGEEGQPADESRAQQGMGVTEPAMERTRQQQEAASEAGKEQPVRGLVYVRRPRPHQDQETGAEEQKNSEQAAMSDHPEDRPEQQQAAEEMGTPAFPAQNEAVQHDNLWKSRAGRKRKVHVEDSGTAPRCGLGRPPKKKTAGKSPKRDGRRKTQPRKKVVVSDDDPDTDGSGPHSDDECSPCESD